MVKRDRQIKNTSHHDDRLYAGKLPVKIVAGAAHPSVEPFVPHSHEEAEFVVVSEGNVHCSVGGERFLLAPGDIACVNPGEAHAATAQTNAACHAILFRYDALEPRHPDACYIKYIEPLRKGACRLPSLPSESCRGGLYPVARGMIEAYGRKARGHELSVVASLYAMLALLAGEGFAIDNVYASKFPSNPDLAMNRVLDYCHSHFSKKIYLDQLAEVANLNKNYFCEYFKEKTGRSPIEYLNILRIEEAKKLIETTDRKLVDIAYAVGFNSFSYFSQVFKSIMGVLPSCYRKEKKGSR